MADTTKNLGLTLPKAEEYYNIEIQNTNMERLDEAVGTAVNVGAYIGDGETERFISLPRTPKFVLVFREGRTVAMYDGFEYLFGGLAITDYPANAGRDYLIIEENGFRVVDIPSGLAPNYATANLNLSEVRYSYLWG